MNLPSLDFGGCGCGGACPSCATTLGYLPVRTPWIYNGTQYYKGGRYFIPPFVPYTQNGIQNYGFPPAIVAAVIGAVAATGAVGLQVGGAKSAANKARKADEAALCPSVGMIDASLARLKAQGKGGLFNTGLFSKTGVGKEMKALKKERKIAAAECSAGGGMLAAEMVLPVPAPATGISTTVLAIGGIILTGLALGAVIISRRSS